MGFNINGLLNPNHVDLFQHDGEELLIYGGSGGGKSYSIADKLLLQSLYQAEKQIKILVIRQTFPALRATVLDILEKRAATLKMPFVLNKAEWTARCRNLKFIFLSLHNKEDYEKLKSMTDVDFIWLNELLELREEDYNECLRRLRGGESDYQQVISDFNPVNEYSWVNVRFFQRNIGDVKKIRYNIEQNHPGYLATDKAQKYIKRLEATKDYNYNLYRIYYLGEWGHLEGVIYDWDIVQLPDIKFDEIFYGGDFGYSVDPAALVKICRKADEFWVKELIYETGLTNDALAGKFQENGEDMQRPSYWDSAEPKSIEELYQKGINAKSCQKGADSVRTGIDFLKSKKIHIVEGSENIIKERKSYVWQTDKHGNQIPKPVDFNNHTMDAIRYGIHTHMKQEIGGVEWASWD